MECYSDFIVDIKQLQKNVENIRTVIGSEVKFCAVVKANAYGMGFGAICRALSGRVDFFAVACLREALAIREIDKTTGIIVLGVVDSSEYIKCAENNISISIGKLSQLENLPEMGNKLKLHIQVNTGLNRFGFRLISEFKKAVKLINSNSNLSIEGVYSHFATKSNDKLFMKKQMFKFNQFKKYISDKKVIVHIANSYAAISNKLYLQTMVRSGFLMYGEMENNIGNASILTIKSRLVNVFTVKRGDTIGYDRTFVVKKSMRIGVVPIGYADGFDRRLSNLFSVLINGEFCKIVGLICMDVFMVDISNVDTSLGDEVIILGKQKNNVITVHDYAKVLNTSPYEVLLKFNYKRMNYVVKQ